MAMRVGELFMWLALFNRIYRINRIPGFYPVYPVG
jgi:hypothetical protein